MGCSSVSTSLIDISSLVADDNGQMSVGGCKENGLDEQAGETEESVGSVGGVWLERVTTLALALTYLGLAFYVESNWWILFCSCC